MRLRASLLTLLTLCTTGVAENRIVFLAGARSHGSGEHEFHAGCQLLAKALNEQSGLDVKAQVIQGWPTDESVLDNAKAIVIYADGTSVVGKGWDKMDALAKKGVGIMFMHYAVHPGAPEGEKYYRPWIGGAFETGLSVNPHWVADLNGLSGHPVSRGVKNPVQALDEFYYGIHFRQNRSEVLDLVTATPTRERIKKYINLWNEYGVAGLDKPQTLMWGVQRPDGGRGVGFTGGHYHRNWSVDDFRKLVLNAIVWTAGVEVPKDGVKSLTLTDDDLNVNLDDKGPNKPRILVPKPGEVTAVPTAEIQVDREAKFPKLAETSAPNPAPSAKPNSQSTAPKPLAESPVLTAESKERFATIEADLKGAKELVLVVSPEGAISCDWSDWLEPVLVKADGSTIDLTTMKWKSAKADSGQVRVDLNNEGGPLKIGGTVFSKGIGTHASSIISFDLPAGVEKFRAKVAIDDGGMVRAGKPSNAKVKFLVYSAQPAPAVSDALPEGITEVPAEMFTVPEGLEVTLWAKSPLLHNPTNIDFDAKGRLWVAEGVNYRSKANRQKEGDKIVVLEDTKHAGVADKGTVFVQEPDLASPLGVAVFENKIIVSQPPNMLVYTDVNGDGVFDPAVDKREVLLTGFGGRQHDHSLHSVTAGPDGLWYWNQGNTGAEFTDNSGKKFYMGSPYQMNKIAGMKSDDGHVWIGGFAARMNPDGTNVSIIGHNFRNSYEQTVTSRGDVFQSDNDDPPACRVTAMMEGGNAGFASTDGKRSWAADRRPGQDVPTAEWRQEDPGTMPAGDVYGGGAPTGVAFVENGTIGDRWNGMLLACESGKNVIYGYFPKLDGADWKLERFDFMTSNKEREWTGSDFLSGQGPKAEVKHYFRPSDVCVGPDGAIYVADWFDSRVGGHGTNDAGYTGAIYRIAPKGFKSVIPQFDLNTTPGQIAALKNPSPNVRFSGFTRLKAQGEKAVPEVAALLADANPYVAARAVWLLAQMGDAGVSKVRTLLQSKDEQTRLVAYRSLRRAGQDVVALATQMTGDESAAVRREVALSLRDVPADKSVALLAKLFAKFDGKDRAYLEALGLGSDGKEAAVYDAVSKSFPKDPLAWNEAQSKLAWRLHPAAAVEALKTRALATTLPLSDRKLMLTALAFSPTKEASVAMVDAVAAKQSGLSDLALWWAMNRQGNDWSEYGLSTLLKERGLYDPANVKLTAVEMPAPIPNAPAMPSVAELTQLTGDAARGKSAVGVCYACHKIAGTGVEFGPELTEFGKQQPKEVLLEAIAYPSKTISHGFEGVEVKTKDGLTITGMPLANGDPVILKCMGGTVQTIPRAKVASMTKMTRSLMYEPSNLGLTPQSIADIVAYLKGL